MNIKRRLHANLKLENKIQQGVLANEDENTVHGLTRKGYFRNNSRVSIYLDTNIYALFQRNFKRCAKQKKYFLFLYSNL